MVEKNNLKFETSDFYLSAFLLARGFELIEVNKENPRRAVFIFKDREDRQSLIEDFLFGRAQVDPKDFASAIKGLKQLLHSEL